mmetsp:Transcript_39365/g.83857  ORF Transcript_39365/g.83857 Transcript_39365/m.83857 type:complete len:213 (+) Transcript_39365:76-714(+)
MPRLSSTALPVCLVALLASAALLSILPSQQVAFVPPTRRGALAASLAAALATATVAVPEPAEAATTAKFSIFGYGNGYQSDPYNLNDADAESPYSQFSNPKDAIYKKQDDVYINSKKALLSKAFSKLDDVAGFIKEKNPEQLKMATQLGQMRPSLIYISGDEGTPAYNKAREFLQEMSDMGVQARAKKWPGVESSYNKAMSKLQEWKSIVNF